MPGRAIIVRILYVRGNGAMGYHQKGRNYPVDKYAKENLLPDVPLGEDLVETLISNFAEDGIHHNEQADS